MRILKFFLLALVYLALGGALIFFLGRELILLFGAKTLQTHYDLLQKKNYSNWCLEKYAYAQEAYQQLRFVSNKEYYLEVVCADFNSTPLLIESHQLPPFLEKTSPGTGLIADQKGLPFLIKLSIFGRSINLYLEEEQLHLAYFAPPDLDYQSGPPSSCQAHGFSCCQLEVENGLGKQLTAVNDCPKSCYETCLLRPLFLSFNSSPSEDSDSQAVEVKSGASVTFSYVLGNGKTDVFAGQIDKNATLNFLEKLQVAWGAKSADKAANLALPVQVNLAFGDGQKWQSENLQDTIDHTYTCQSATCYFQAQISAQDAQGGQSLESETSSIMIKVQR